MNEQNQIVLHKCAGRRLVYPILLMYIFLFNPFEVTAGPSSHNIILFIADGLRPGSITQSATPTLWNIKTEGVYFANSHSLFPSYTMSNASAFATGHKLGDTGIYGNSIYLGSTAHSTDLNIIPFLENNTVLSSLDKIFSGDFLNQETVLKIARQTGYSTALIGKVGPILLFDHTKNTDEERIIIDDMTGSEGGVPLPAEVQNLLIEVGLDIKAPPRGNNGKAGASNQKGTLEANRVQQEYFSLVTTKVLLPLFKKRNKPFVLVYWSRDPDGTEHNQGDSLNRLLPGINGETSEDAIKNADNNLKDLISSLEKLDLKKSTNILVASDHGISTVSKESATSYSTTQSYADVPSQFLPPGFVAIDLAQEFNLSLFDPDDSLKKIDKGKHPLRSSGYLGLEKSNPKIIVAGNGGSDLLYLPQKDTEFVKDIISFFSKQDYVSGIFVHDRYGQIPGTLPLSSIELIGSAVTPAPSIILNFRSFSTGCDDPLMCSVVIADTRFQQGQGMHGSFSQADIKNFAAAIGPSFKKKFVDHAPINSADIGQTLAYLLKVSVRNTGSLKGRVLSEALQNGKTQKWKRRTVFSRPDKNGQRTILRFQEIGGFRYFDSAGYEGRTLGLQNKHGEPDLGDP